MDLGIASRPKKGESLNGDAYLVGEYDGTVLLAVIDGMGHGENANYAAAKASSFLENHHHLNLVAMIKGCHQELRGTRGAVLGMALIKEKVGLLSYSGIGNIEATIVGEGKSCLISMAGIVGHNLKKVKEFQYPYNPGDTIIMFSDGISSRFDIAEFLPLVDLQTVAERILEKYSKDDDATILLARQTRDPCS